jgi:serine protease inhibitor
VRASECAPASARQRVRASECTLHTSECAIPTFFKYNILTFISEGQRLSMVVLLPAQTETENLTTLENALQNIPDIHSLLQFKHKMKVDLALPKFKVSVCCY